MELMILPGILHELPDDIKASLKENDALVKIWNTLTPIQRNEWICWVTMVKQQKTRIEHLQRMLEDLQNGEKKPCCWPGCPHRNPNNKKWFKNLDEFKNT